MIYVFQIHRSMLFEGYYINVRMGSGLCLLFVVVVVCLCLLVCCLIFRAFYFVVFGVRTSLAFVHDIYTGMVLSRTHASHTSSAYLPPSKNTQTFFIHFFSYDDKDRTSSIKGGKKWNPNQNDTSIH